MLLASRYGTVASAGAKKIAAVVSTEFGAAHTYNGTSWTYVAYTNSILDNPVHSIRGALGPGGVAFIGSATSTPVRSSTDFVTYAEQAGPGSTYGSYRGAFYHDGVWAVGSAYSVLKWYPNLSYSTDLITWTANNPQATGSGDSYTNCIFHDGTQWLAGIYGGTDLQTNTDVTTSTTWALKSTPWLRTWNIAYDGTTYVVAANLTNVFYSTDLVTWTAVAPGAATQLAAYGNGRFVVAGTSLYYSTNSGASWTLGTIPGPIYDLRFSATLGKFMIGSTNGDVYLSDDAVTWTTSNIGTTDTVKAVAAQ